MSKVYLYEYHDGWEDLMYVTDHELSDIERFCTLCEDWDRLIAVINTREELVSHLADYSIFENSGEHTDCFKNIMSAYEEYSSDDHVIAITPKEELPVGLFFYVDGNFAFAGCSLSKAETYGDFLIFPEGHYDTWEHYSYLKYTKAGMEVDYDYYPRGRVVYRKSDDTFIIYHDKCVTDVINRISDRYEGYNYKLELDEHYCCHMCNADYVM